MTNCRDKCWCKKLKAKEPDPDSPPLLYDLYAIAHKIDHLYDGIEKCFTRIEALEAMKMQVPDMSKYPEFEKFIKRKDKFILDENNNVIPADLFEWSNFFENELEKRIVRQDEVNKKWISSVFLGIDHGFSLFDPENHKPLIFETMVFNSKKGGEEIYCRRYSTWEETEEGHKKAIQWVIDGCNDKDDENE